MAMPLSMHQAAAPVFVQVLGALSKVLDKAEAHAAGRKIDPAVLIAARLAPDMFPLSKQVQLTCDFAKGAMARLAGSEVPSWPDTEKTFEDLRGRIRRAIEYVESFKPAQLDGSDEREVKLTMAGTPVTLKGQPYLLRFVLPNFLFHATAAYAILRHNGVELGKRDFIGQVPGLTS
jgi:uncharacterized protein